MARRVWKQSGTSGIRYYEHPKRRYKNRLDRFYQIRFQQNGRRIEESVGWESVLAKTNSKSAMKTSISRLEVLKASARLAKQMGQPWKPETDKERRAKDKARLRREQATVASCFQLHLERVENRPTSRLRKSKTTADEINLYENWIHPEKRVERLYRKIEELKQPVEGTRSAKIRGRLKMKAKRKRQIEQTLRQISTSQKRPSIGMRRLAEVTGADIEKIVGALAKAKRSDRTVVAVLSIIRQIYRRAIKEGLFDGVIPTERIEWPTLSNGRKRHLTVEEADKLIGALRKQSQMVADMALLALLCGLRRGEVLALRWEDIDFERGVMAIRNTKNKEDRGLMMDARIVKILRDRHDYVLPSSETELVFPGKNGNRRQKVPMIFKRVADELFNKGVADRLQIVSFHTLRHSFSTWLAQLGAPETMARKLTGHRTREMFDRYVHASAEATAPVVRLLEQVDVARPELRVVGQDD